MSTSPSPPFRDPLRCLVDVLPFDQWGCNRITAVVDKHFTHSRRLVEGVGFKLEGVVRKVLPGDWKYPSGRDAVIYGLLRQDFEEGRFGQPAQPKIKQTA